MMRNDTYYKNTIHEATRAGGGNAERRIKISHNF
jgi:hypothetical protein